MKSFENPNETFQTNALGTLNLFEAIRNSNTDPVIQLSSSSEVYGKVSKDQIPIKENVLFFPTNPYGISKLAGERWCEYYFNKFNHHNCFIFIPFN